MAGQTRKSKQRDRILEVLKQTRSHPTAKWIYDKVRKLYPDLSLGTVYRNLGMLVKQGFVSKLDFGSLYDRFEARTLPHHHFLCEQCGSVSDLDLPIDHSLTKKLKSATGLKASRREIRFYGVCEKCSGKK